MVRAKGLDELFLAGSRPRFRRWYPVPAGVRERRALQDLAEPGRVNGGGTLQQARTATRAAIEGFVSDVVAARGEALLVMAAPGAGKSTALAEAVKRHRVEARIVVGTKALAKEQAEQHGYNLIVGRNGSNCERYDVVRALGEAGHPVEPLACGTPFKPRCPFRAHCRYFAQFERSGPRVAAAEQLFNRHFLMGGTLAVADDADLVRSLVERSQIRAEVLERADAQLAGGALEPERTVLRVIHHALIDAGNDWLSGGWAWDHIAGAAARQGLDLVSLVEALPARETLPEPFDDYDGYVSVATVEAVPPASVAALLTALREELDRFRAGEDFNSRIRVSHGCIEVGRVRVHICDREGVIIARMPMLVLDATPVAALVDDLTALHERLPDVTGEIALPANVAVVQYATGSNGHTSLRSEGTLERVLGEIQAQRHELPCDVRDEALVVYKEVLQRFEGASFAADRVLTFGAARGTNALAAVRRLHVVGRPHPPREDTFYMAQVIHHDEAAVSPEIVLRSRAFGAQACAIDVVDYADARMAALLKAARDDELSQVLHRARLLTLDPQAGMDGDARNGVRLVLHTSHPVPGLRVDRLIRDGADAGRDRNGERSRDARSRIEAAHRRLVAACRPVTIESVAAEAGASWRTARKHLGTTLHTPVEERLLNLQPEASPEARLGTRLHTPVIDLKGGVQTCPQTAAAGPGAESQSGRSHWTPCRGGCGGFMPPGQQCFECAAKAVRDWKAAQRERSAAS